MKTELLDGELTTLQKLKFVASNLTWSKLLWNRRVFDLKDARRVSLLCHMSSVLALNIIMGLKFSMHIDYLKCENLGPSILMVLWLHFFTT